VCSIGCQALQPAEMAIFMLNNVSVIQQEILETSRRHRARGQEKDKGSIAWLDLLDTEAATWMEILVKEEVARMLRRSDLVRASFLPLHCLPTLFLWKHIRTSCWS
jgi:hypothetical protein